MPFDPSRKYNYSSNGIVVQQDGVLYIKNTGELCDEDGNLAKGQTQADMGADALVTAAEKKSEPTVVPNEKIKTDDELDAAYTERRDALKGMSAAKLKETALNVMAALDEDGVEDYDKAQMSGAGVVDALRDFIAKYTG